MIKGIWAVIPVKNTQHAKQRLGDAVPPRLKPGFALAMFEDVLSAVTRAQGLSGVAVITVDPAAARLARRYGASPISCGTAEGGHTAVIGAAARLLARDGAEGILQVPGDIPLITADEINVLLSKHRAAPAFTIAPSHDEYGSNAILVSPPKAVPLTFGDDSFFPHLSAAKALGIEPTVVRLPGIGFDIDKPEDLQSFMRLHSSTRAQAYLDRNGLSLNTARHNCRGVA